MRFLKDENKSVSIYSRLHLKNTSVFPNIYVKYSFLIILLGSLLIIGYYGMFISNDTDKAVYSKYRKLLGFESDAGKSILMLGSSSFEFMPREILKDCKELLNNGVGASRLDHIIYFLENSINIGSIKKYIFYIGENDIADGRKANELKGKYQRIVSLVREINEDAVIYIYMQKITPARYFLKSEISKLNTVITKLGETGKEIKILPYNEESIYIYDGTLLDSDGLHLSDKGYQIYFRDLMRICSE